MQKPPNSLSSEPGTDPDFEAVRADNLARGYVDRLWRRYSILAEKGFPELIRSHFVERFSEMYVACHLLDAGCEVLRRHEGGPDFLVRSPSGPFLLEVTAPEAGRGRGTMPAAVYDGKAHKVPSEEMDYRLVNSLEDKRDQWRRHVQKHPDDANLPVVLFVNMARAQYGWLAQDMPLSLVLGTHGLEGATEDGIAYACGQFLRPEYRWLGAVVAARVHAGTVAGPGDYDLLVIHNPNAEPRAPEGVWNGAREYTRAACELMIRG